MCPVLMMSVIWSEGQVSTSVTDIRSLQHCGEMSAQLAPSLCDEAWTDAHGGRRDKASRNRDDSTLQ